jgi:hypothetical protein
MCLREIGCEGVKWADLAKDREQKRILVNTAMKRGEFLDQPSN